MTKILMYSDLHIGANRVDLEKVKSTLSWINNIAKQEECSYIFNLGDTFDFYNHNKSKMSLTPKMLEDLKNYGDLFKGHYILRGNHEYNEQGDLIDVFSMYRAYPITEPKYLEDLDVLLLPYSEEPYNLYKKNYKYILGHYDIKGAKFESGAKDESNDSIVIKDLTWDTMYIGHYHIKQKIRENIISIGAVQSRVRSNNLEKMGITILDVDTGETEFIENPYATYDIPEEKSSSKSKVINLETEIENFKLEKSGLDAIIDYVNSKTDTYDADTIEYVLYFLRGLKG